MCTVWVSTRYILVPHPPFVEYRRRLKQSARLLRRDPTPAEKKLWYEFLRDLPQRFTRQKPLRDYIADFYCASSLLVIEVDGDSHYTIGGAAHDVRRDAALVAQGLRVIRFTNSEVMQQFEGVCERIRNALKT